MLSDRRYVNLVLLAIPHTIATLGLALQIASPLLLSFLPWKYVSCLFYFPYYMGWKGLIALGARPRTWVRTAREPVEPRS
jgi:hypothetical protein